MQYILYTHIHTYIHTYIHPYTHPPIHTPIYSLMLLDGPLLHKPHDAGVGDRGVAVEGRVISH
jgi:hypothetical protein